MKKKLGTVLLLCVCISLFSACLSSRDSEFSENKSGSISNSTTVLTDLTIIPTGSKEIQSSAQIIEKKDNKKTASYAKTTLNESTSNHKSNNQITTTIDKSIHTDITTKSSESTSTTNVGSVENKNILAATVPSDQDSDWMPWKP